MQSGMTPILLQALGWELHFVPDAIPLRAITSITGEEHNVGGRSPEKQFDVAANCFKLGSVKISDGIGPEKALLLMSTVTKEKV